MLEGEFRGTQKQISLGILVDYRLDNCPLKLTTPACLGLR